MTLMFDNRIKDSDVFNHENPVNRKEVGRSLRKAFDNLIGAYHQRVADEGVEVDALQNVKRQRKGR